MQNTNNQDNCTIIALSNQKGGVGKTTAAVNLSASVGKLGKRVLLVDLDPQGNSTSGVGIIQKNGGKSVYEAINGVISPREAVHETKFKISIMTSCIALAGAELELAELDDRHFKLKKVLDELRSDFDYIFIDCPPSLSLLTLNALTAADYVVVPMQCEYFALEGLVMLVTTIKTVKNLYNSNLDLLGVIITMFDGRLNLSLDVLEEIKKHFRPEQIFKKPIPRNVKVAEAPSYGVPVYYYDKYSKGALAYMDIAKELIEKTSTQKR